MEKKINVFILTGFLGAGKTTVLNQLLKQFEGENNVVIENEFGKTNIDAQLITSKFESVYEITNGCICCSLDEELYDTLSEIARRKSEVDNIFIETTGIADAGNIATLFKVDQVAEVFNLKKVICIVDSESLEDCMDQAIEPQRQLVAADLIILNKTLLVSEFYVSKLEQIVASINPYAVIAKSETGFFRSQLLFDKNQEQKIAFSKKINIENGHKINHILYESGETFDYLALYHTLNTTLFIYYNQVFRIKGFIKCVDSSEQNSEVKIYEVQSTGKTLTIAEIKKEDFTQNQLVFIGKQLKTDTVTRILRGAIIKDKVNIRNTIYS